MFETSEKPSFWQPVSGSRYPWAPASVAEQIRGWLIEAQYAEALEAAGEKLMPLLLAGPTRCGKTSTLRHIADFYALPVFRMAISSAIGSFMGETTRHLIAALAEAKATAKSVWILDELDGLFQKRGKGSDGASKEWNAALAACLAAIESLPSNVLLVGTTNAPDLVDPAMLSRFQVVRFPEWDDISDEQKQAFARSHGCQEAGRARSYADAVQMARAVRVQKIIAEQRRRSSDERR